MSLSFNSISEYAISELPYTRPVADLEIELFTDLSVVKNLPQDTATLTLSYANDEIYPVYYGGNRNSWFVPLQTTAADVVQNIYNFVDTASLLLDSTLVTSTRLNSVETTSLDLTIDESISTRHEIPQDTIALASSISSYEQPSWLISDPAVLSADGDYFHNLKLYSNETGVLSVEVVEKQFADDAPSESWRPRPGLPIGPISLSAIGIEQTEGPLTKSYPVIDQAGLELASEVATSTTLSYTESGQVVIASSSIDLQSYNFVEQGNLSTVSITEQISYLNSRDALSLEISASDQIVQIFKFEEDASVDLAAEQTNSAAINSIDSGNLTTISIRDVVVFLNSYETASLEIAAQDQIQQIFEFFEVAEIILENDDVTSSTLNDSAIVELSLQDDITFSVALDYRDTAGGTLESTALESKTSSYSDNLLLVTEPNDLISMRYYSFDTAVTTINAKTFAKEYTFLQQEFAIDQFELKLSAESSESFRPSSGVIRSRQFWIG